MKWVYASVVALATGVCSGASSQSIPPPATPSLEPASGLFQTVQYQYDGRGYDNDRDDGYYGDRDFRDNDRDRDAGRDRDEDNRDSDDAYRQDADTDDDNDRNGAYRDRDDRDDQRAAGVADYNRGYQDGYRARGQQLDQRTTPRVRIDRARFERCTRRYRTFDAATGTYVGFDGRRHVCL